MQFLTVFLQNSCKQSVFTSTTQVQFSFIGFFWFSFSWNGWTATEVRFFLVQSSLSPVFFQFYGLDFKDLVVFRDSEIRGRIMECTHSISNHLKGEWVLVGDWQESLKEWTEFKAKGSRQIVSFVDSESWGRTHWVRQCQWNECFNEHGLESLICNWDMSGILLMMWWWQQVRCSDQWQSIDFKLRLLKTRVQKYYYTEY